MTKRELTYFINLLDACFNASFLNFDINIIMFLKKKIFKLHYT